MVTNRDVHLKLPAPASCQASRGQRLCPQGPVPRVALLGLCTMPTGCWEGSAVHVQVSRGTRLRARATALHHSRGPACSLISTHVPTPLPELCDTVALLRWPPCRRLMWDTDLPEETDKVGYGSRYHVKLCFKKDPGFRAGVGGAKGWEAAGEATCSSEQRPLKGRAALPAILELDPLKPL